MPLEPNGNLGVKKLGSSPSQSSNVTFTDLTDLAFPVLNGRTYVFTYILLAQSVITTTGVVLSMSTPTGTLAALVSAQAAADGVSSMFSGSITASGDIVTSTGVRANGLPDVILVEGFFTATADGTVTLRFRSEINGSAVQINAGSICRPEDMG